MNTIKNIMKAAAEKFDAQMSGCVGTQVPLPLYDMAREYLTMDSIEHTVEMREDERDGHDWHSDMRYAELRLMETLIKRCTNGSVIVSLSRPFWDAVLELEKLRH